MTAWVSRKALLKVGGKKSKTWKVVLNDHTAVGSRKVKTESVRRKSEWPNTKQSKSE